MLFAALDYRKFRKHAGAYDLSKSSHQLGAAFEGEIPEEVR